MAVATEPDPNGRAKWLFEFITSRQHHEIRLRRAHQAPWIEHDLEPGCFFDVAYEFGEIACASAAQQDLPITDALEFHEEGGISEVVGIEHREVGREAGVEGPIEGEDIGLQRCAKANRAPS